MCSLSIANGRNKWNWNKWLIDNAIDVPIICAFAKIPWNCVAESYFLILHTHTHDCNDDNLGKCVCLCYTQSQQNRILAVQKRCLSHNNCLNHWLLRIHISNRFDWSEYFMEILCRLLDTYLQTFQHVRSTCVNVSHSNYAILTLCYVSVPQRQKEKGMEQPSELNDCLCQV